MSDLYLSDEEVKTITGKVRSSWQKKALEEMGYTVKVRPDGSFWVPRGQFLDAKKVEPEKKYTLNLEALSDGQAA